ncbi:hypothetical protein LOTGIDRAFT_170124 [Lottia gigantea]|uniref:Death domain-containing protein n=1 Tax=Lottia gigantea TaxID=225164 RepID=V3ZE72_LOTGI|nr:hypothetical protein LOTGIDRAFT_170124 [Lottia gigantea]ESO82342.1 hypothetical protein LOTGIDRAFT_170124 [Lottia gigantea]
MNNKDNRTMNYTAINNCENVYMNSPHGLVNNTSIIAQTVVIGDFNTVNNYQGSYQDEESSDDESLSNDQEDQLATCVATIDDGTLQEISQTFANNWKNLGKALNLSAEQIDKVRSKYMSKGLEELSYQILNTWKENHKNPMICDLAKSFEKNEDLAEEYKKQLYKAVLKPKNHPAIEGPAQRLSIDLPTSTQ